MSNQEILKGNDFNKPIFETSTKLARIIAEDMLANFELFMEGYEEMTFEEKKELNNKRIEYANELLMKMAQTDIPADYATFSIMKVIAALKVIEDYLTQCLESWNKEILTRVKGVRSPLDGKFDQEFATLKDVMDTVMKLRKETGPDDYLPDYKREKFQLSTDDIAKE